MTLPAPEAAAVVAAVSCDGVSTTTSPRTLVHTVDLDELRAVTADASDGGHGVRVMVWGTVRMDDRSGLGGSAVLRIRRWYSEAVLCGMARACEAARREAHRRELLALPLLAHCNGAMRDVGQLVHAQLVRSARRDVEVLTISDGERRRAHPKGSSTAAAVMAAASCAGCAARAAGASWTRAPRWSRPRLRPPRSAAAVRATADRSAP